MLPMENFFVLATLIVFIFREIIPFLPSHYENKFFQNKFLKTLTRVLKFKYNFYK